MRSRKRVLATCAVAALTAVCAGSAGGEAIRIDAPGVLDRPGATYVLTKDVTAARTAFMIRADGITLDLGGHTVTYGTEIGVDRCSGVFLRPRGREEGFVGVPKEGFGGANDFTLKNGRIVQGAQPVAPPGAITYRYGRLVKEAGDHPRPGRSCHAVYVRGCRGLEIANVTTEVNSRDTDNLYVRECSDVRIHHNHCISRVREITNRHYPGTGVITVAVGGPAEIHDNIIDGGGQWGIRTEGSGLTGPLVKVHHNVIRHRSYTTNGYALGCHAPNMRVYANVIRSIGRGVHLTARNIDFHNNIVEPRERPNPEYPRTRTHGIKLEGCTHSSVHHNFCRVVAEKGFGDADPLDLGVHAYSANRVYKNTIVAIRRSPEFWASSINIVESGMPSFTVVHDNVFRTNRWHVRGDWGGARGMTFVNNRFEVIGDGADYQFAALKQSRAARTYDMVFRDNVVAPPADFRKAHQLYGRSYTRRNIDLAFQWTVNVRTADPAGKAVAGVAVKAIKDGADVAEAVTDRAGAASLVLTDFHVIGAADGGVEEHGPYVLVLSRDGREVSRERIDRGKTVDVTKTVTDPKRKLYVYAGPDQRHERGETAELVGKVVVLGDESAAPAVRWRILGKGGEAAIADPDALATTAAMTTNGSWTVELEAKLGGEVARDTLAIRTDTHVTPVAVARCPAAAKVDTIVQLDGTSSRDPRRFPSHRLRYGWKQIAGPEAILSSAELPDPIFFPAQAGAYTFELTLANPLRTSRPTRCTVKVTK
ncbi:MAG: right-handed parallel beta-helix repeat-containing protein [Planctomycetota bacterium]|jgi:hypothetical protein